MAAPITIKSTIAPTLANIATFTPPWLLSAPSEAGGRVGCTNVFGPVVAEVDDISVRVTTAVRVAAELIGIAAVEVGTIGRGTVFFDMISESLKIETISKVRQVDYSSAVVFSMKTQIAVYHLKKTQITQ
jgi:hypothetical protein